MFQLLTAVLSLATAQANNPAPPTIGLSPEAMAAAEDVGTINRRQLNALEPKRSRLPNHPYTHTDFTAYSLEWGETRLGLAQIRVGILPRVQVGTIPAGLAFGVLNGNAKVNFLRVGPFDMAATAAHFRYGRDQFDASSTQLGGTASLQVVPKWSLHVTGRWQSTGASGIPNLNDNPWLLETFAPDVQSQAEQAEATGLVSQEEVINRAQNEYGDRFLQAQAVTLKVATDLRLNRRDSIIIQAQANVHSALDTNMDLDAVAAEDRFAAMAIEGVEAEGIADTYITSVAWQFSWHRADLRLGVGMSSVPGAWVTQTADFAWRFGGKTRRTETRMTRTWKSNRRDLRRASHGRAPAPEAT
ncbi:MAG: hypothetical protein CL927_07890 [Deltaproteobacteria bacterium]|nr:hypothetical protein [Deltaproteobacteria bacterium]HCH66867.1 hypothetical protein [Deltaproteobacteria bacterium]